MLALAFRIIAHSPLRYLVALLGISAAAGLALIQYGLYLGFKENASVIVDHTEGDVWICAQYQNNFDFPNLITTKSLDQVRGTPGVAWAEPMLIVFGHWKLPNGEEKTVQIIGFDTESGVGGPWTMIAGLPADLTTPGRVTVDTSTAHKLAGAELGDRAEINGIKVNVAGVTHGIRTFQGNPVVFASMSTARSIARLDDSELHYVIAKLTPDAERDLVLERLNELDPFTEAYTAPQFSFKAQDYWLRSTGAGTALFFAAVMGLVVGIVVAGQVLYTSTLEHIREYGTLKAIGATNFQVGAAIVAQAVSWALPAHLIAGLLLLVAARNISGKGIHLSLDTGTYLELGILTVGVCIAASLLSVIKVMKVEPADVFKG